MGEVKFYFDESVELAVSIQLAAGGLDVVSAHSLERLYYRGLAYEKKGAKESAIADYEQAFKIDPDHPDAKNALVRLNGKR